MKEVLFILTIMLFVIGGCKEKAADTSTPASKFIHVTPYPNKQKELPVPAEDEALLFFIPQKVKPTDLSIDAVLINHSGYEAIAGDGSYLQILKDEQWETIPKSYIYTSIGYEIANGDSMRFNCELDLLGNEREHSPGTYRLCKEILIQPEIQVAIDTTAHPTNRANNALITLSVENELLSLQEGAFNLHITNRSRHNLRITELGYFKLISNTPEERYYVQTTTSPRLLEMPAHSTLPLHLPLRNLPHMRPFKPGLYTLHLNINVILTYEFKI